MIPFVHSTATARQTFMRPKPRVKDSTLGLFQPHTRCTFITTLVTVDFSRWIYLEPNFYTPIDASTGSFIEDDGLSGGGC